MAIFSNSRLNSFETCPKKYEFCYILKTPRGPGGIEAYLGSRVHDALQWLYTEVGFCRQPSADDLVAWYRDVWDREWSDDVCVTRDDRTVEDYRATGEKQLRDYHARYQPFDQGVTVGLELRVDFALDDAGVFRMVGYIDRLTKTADGVWEIHDYKTSRKLMTQQEADADRQLALYEIAVRAAHPEVREVALVWHYLAFDQEVRSSRTREQLDRLRGDAIEGIRAAEAATEFPTHTSRLCDWCDYKIVCPAFKHAAETAALPVDEFAAEPGVALVDRYMQLCDQLSDLKDEQERVRQAIIARADSEGLDVLVGTENSLRVWRYTSVQLPGYQDPRRAEVEAVLRDEGVWDRFAQLSTFSLAKAVEGHQLPEHTMERLVPYVTFSPGAKLYSRKRADQGGGV